jgi:hypothetical protein
MSIVSVRLIRDLNPSFDDLVIIKRSVNNIVVTYTDNSAKNICHPAMKETLTLTSTDLGRYIQNLGYLFMDDKDPFKEMQVNFPGFPTFLMTRESIKNVNTQEALVDIAKIVSESWFTDYTQKCFCGCEPYQG